MISLRFCLRALATLVIAANAAHAQTAVVNGGADIGPSTAAELKGSASIFLSDAHPFNSSGDPE